MNAGDFWMPGINAVDLWSAQAISRARRCIELFLWSRSEAQWAAHYVSATGEWEWYFW